MVGLRANSSKRTSATHCTSQSAAARAPVPAASHCWSVPPQETLTHLKFHNQGKLELVKHRRWRVNIDIIGISELKWTGMGEFNSDDHYICCCGKESLGRNWVALRVNKSPKCSTWAQSQKWQNDLCSFPRQTIQYHSNLTLCPIHYCQRSSSWMVLWRPTRPSRANAKKRCSSHHRGLECKSR